MIVREVKDKQAQVAFKRMIRQAMEVGFKPPIPLTIKQYAKVHGSKYATTDWYFEMSKSLTQFYESTAKTAKAIRDRYADDTYQTRMEMKPISKRSQVDQFNIYTRYLKTFKNVLNPNYYTGDMAPKEKNRLIKKRKWEINESTGKKRRIVVEAGLRSKPYHPVTLSTFGGSIVKLRYNNYLVGLTDLGYTETLNYLLSISPSEFERKWQHIKDTEGKSGVEALELAYHYDDQGNHIKDKSLMEKFRNA